MLILFSSRGLSGAFGEPLGCLSGLLRASGVLSGDSWRLLVEFLSASCGSLTLSKSKIGSISRILKKCLFREREHDFQHLEASGRLLGAS